MLYRNEMNDLIYQRESDGKKYLLMEGMDFGKNGNKKSYDVIVVFEYDEESGDFGSVATWLYGAAFAESEDTLDWLKNNIG